MTAEVRFEPVRRRDGGEKGMEFVAKSDCFADLNSPNINVLYAKVQDAFRTYELAQRGIVWEDWFEVIIKPEDEYGFRDEASAASSGLVVGYRTIKRGVDPRDGRVYTIHDHGMVTPFPLPKAAGSKKDRSGKEIDAEWDRRDIDDQYAYIPATPENRAALDDIIGRLRALHGRLASFLVQDVIVGKLAGVASNLLTFAGDVSPSETRPTELDNVPSKA